MVFASLPYLPVSPPLYSDGQCLNNNNTVLSASVFIKLNVVTVMKPFNIFKKKGCLAP
jgi:hypothetical protein